MRRLCLLALLAACASRQVVKVTVFLADLGDYKTMHAIYAEYFSEARPARAAVEVARIPRDVGIEIECIARR